MKLLFDQQSHQQELEQDSENHILDLVQGRQLFGEKIKQQKEQGDLKLTLARKSAAAKPQTNGKPKVTG